MFQTSAVLAVAGPLLRKNLLCAGKRVIFFPLLSDTTKYAFDKGSDKRLYIQDL